MKICAIVGAADFYSERFFRDSYELIIAADGGFSSLSKIGVTPDVLVGDMDSLEGLPSGIEICRFKVEKDETDMMLALLEGAKRGYDVFHIFGGVGGRIDHTFANYCLLKYAKDRGISAYLMDKDYYAFVIKNEKIELCGGCGKTFSLFAFGAAATGVTVRGAKYEVENATITPEFAIGVSNSFVGESTEIAVTDGSLLVMAEYK